MLNLIPPKRGAPAAIKTSSHQHPTFIQASHSAARTTHCHGGSWRKCHAGRIQDPWRLRNMRPFGQMDKLMGPWKKTCFAAGCSLQDRNRQCFRIADMVNSCWGKFVFFDVYLVCFFLPGHSVLKWSALPSKPPKTMIRLEGINKGLHVGVPPKAKGMIRKHHAWTPGLLSTTHWLPKINYKKHKKYIIWFSDTLAPKVCKSIIIHHILHINTNSTQIPSWFLIGTLAEKWQLK